MSATDEIAAALEISGALEGLAWKVRVGRRCTVGLTIEPDASVTIAVPAAIDPQAVAAIVQNRRPWLLNKSAQRATSLPAHPAKRIISGENYPFLGRHQRLYIVQHQDVPIRRDGNWLRLRQMSPDAGADAIISWYHEEGRHWLTARLDRWTGRLGVVPTSIDVRDLGRRWGLFDYKTGPTFHWALLQLDPSLIDYVSVHELAHYDDHHHGRTFWIKVEGVLPDFAARKARLDKLGRSVWLGDVLADRPQPRQQRKPP
jgi:predicted metal-dependent hydrolase